MLHPAFPAGLFWEPHTQAGPTGWKMFQDATKEKIKKYFYAAIYAPKPFGLQSNFDLFVASFLHIFDWLVQQVLNGKKLPFLS